MDEYLQFINAMNSNRRTGVVKKYQEGNSIDREYGSNDLYNYDGREVRYSQNKMYLIPKPGEDPNSSEYISALNAFSNDQNFKNFTKTYFKLPNPLDVGDYVADEDSSDFNEANSQSNSPEIQHNQQSNQPGSNYNEELDRVKRRNEAAAGTAAYMATIGNVGQMVGNYKVANDLYSDKNQIHMSQDLRSAGDSYAGVQDKVNRANDYSKEQNIMASRDNMINNISMAGPYGTFIAAGLQAASTAMDSSGLTTKLIERSTAGERNEAERQKNVAEGIVSEGKDILRAGQNGSGIAMANNKLNGEQQTQIKVGEDGMSMPDNFDRHELVDLEDSSFNVIPEGALHEELNDLPKINSEFNDLTHKGIPVVSEEVDGLLQHAEIERGEIILRLALTNRLMELMNDGSYQAQVEAGKLLSDEILNNTRDNIGLMKSLKKNGQVQG